VPIPRIVWNVANRLASWSLLAARAFRAEARNDRLVRGQFSLWSTRFNSATRHFVPKYGPLQLDCGGRSKKSWAGAAKRTRTSTGCPTSTSS
jgi:hypothetical protein